MRRLALLLVLVLGAGLAGCGEAEQPKPPPRSWDRDALGYYCNMVVVEHRGPKAQIFLSGREDPLWFTSVRDGIAFSRSKEEPGRILAFYVNDMGSTDWDQPSDKSWIDAETAWYVIGSSKRGGMGMPEAVPFKDRDKAEAFARKYGGRVVRFDEIPDDYIFSTSEPAPEVPQG